ncbi:ABC transporter ATP-binding protein [Iodobacter sp.]|uniref:ABC transporter ATP-binding protein n=1 Tax=Iodobacter sp. TaxID=1915058 RepID=UPI0025E86262|nr:ATP-binding cassette domain-containing protein [Iodobacter sp.]
MTTTSLQIAELVVNRSGKQVLHGVSLNIPAGAVTTLLGANGAGKSSLVLAIAGVIAPASGTVSANGKILTGLRPEQVRKQGVAIVQEGHQVLSELTVLDNLRAAGSALSNQKLQSGIERMMVIFPELEAKLSSRGGDLSGGQKQMVSISQALLAVPQYLLIDELSLGLAPGVVKRLAETVQQIAESGVGVLLIEQFTSIALGLAEKAYVMERGRIVFSGSSQQLRDDPAILHSAYLA